MNKFILPFLAVSAFLLCSRIAEAQRVLIRHNPDVNSSRILIVYYSPEDYVKNLAQAIHDQTDGDLFEILPRHKYPEDHNEMLLQAAAEFEDGFLPYLPFKMGSLERYDIIFIGSPVWNGHLPPAVSSFFNDYDLSGKKIIPFFSFDEDSDSAIVAETAAQCHGCNFDIQGFITRKDDTFGLQKWLDEIDFDDLKEEQE